MNAGNADLAEIREILEDIIRDDKRAGEVIHRLRAMLQKGEMSKERLSVEQVIAEAIALLNGELMVQGVDVQVHAAAQLLEVEAGRVELQQVLVNLLLNAARAMQELPSSERVIKIRIDAGDGDIVVAVEDRGQGIAADDLPRLFEPFFTTVSDGMGMGLAICRRILQSHGGRIWVENNASGGATFFFSLPVSEQNIIDD